MEPWKLRILLCVVFLVIVSLATNYRPTPLLPSKGLPPSSRVAVGTPVEREPTPRRASASLTGRLNLSIPVGGVRLDPLIDTFDDARSKSRAHDAIDIPAP